MIKPISTLRPEEDTKKLPIKTIAIYVAAVVGVALLVYFGGSIIKNIANIRGKSSLAVNILNGEGEVYLNGEYLGVTPIDSKDIKAGDNKVTVKNNSNQYETSITFLPDSQVIINRDLGVSETFSSGQDFWIEQNKSGTVLSIISNPTGATVLIDNAEVGKAPFSSNQLSDGEYDLKVEYPGHESQTARIKIQKGYKLNVSMKLFPMPVASTVNLMDGSTSLYNVASSQMTTFTDTAGWVKAVIYWNRTRGINVSDLGTNKDLIFDYFLDYKGDVYKKDGSVITGSSEYDLIKAAKKGAYLGKFSDGAGLSAQAKETYQTIFNGVPVGSNIPAGSKKGKIKETGTGWLRVRDEPSLNGKEVAKVNVGQELAVLDTKTGWVKLQVTDVLQGWASADYVTVSQ